MLHRFSYYRQHHNSMWIFFSFYIHNKSTVAPSPCQLCSPRGCKALSSAGSLTAVCKRPLSFRVIRGGESKIGVKCWHPLELCHYASLPSPPPLCFPSSCLALVAPMVAFSYGSCCISSSCHTQL